MRIGMTCYPTYGGSGIVATELGKELAERGHEVHFISYAQPIRLDPEQPRIFYHEVEVSNYPLFEFPPYSLALASRMAEVAEREMLDLLHVHYAIPHSVSAFLARNMMSRPLPFITTLHGTDITLVGVDRSYLPITRFSIQVSDGVTSISNYLKERTCEEFEVSRPIEVIPNFVNCDLYQRHPDPHLRQRFAPDGEPVVLHLSNFRPVKRVRDVIEVFARMGQDVAAHLIMIGDGPDRGSAEYLARKLGVSQRVSFVGKQDNIRDFLSIGDLMLLPSEMESFGLAALEAMAHGVPAIASNVGGLPEVIENGKDGYLFAVGDLDGMANCARSLLENPARLKETGRLARQTAERRFCSSHIIPQYERFYEQVLRRATGRGAGE